MIPQATPEEIVAAVMALAVCIVAGRLLGRLVCGPAPRMRRLHNIDVRQTRPAFNAEAHELRNSADGEGA